MGLITVEAPDNTKERPAGLAIMPAIIIEIKDVTLIPTRLDVGGDCATLSGPIQMKPGTFAYSVYITEDTGIVSSALVGEIDGRSYETTVTLMNRFYDKYTKSLARMMSNAALLVIVQDRQGQWVVCGDFGRSMRLGGDSNLTTGEDGTAASSKGFTVAMIGGTLEPALYPPTENPLDLLLPGTLQLAPSSIIATGADINFEYVAEATDGYEIDIATDAAFANLVITNQAVAQGVQGTITDAVTGLITATTYYTRVRTVQGAFRSSWSNTRSFVTL